jgi:hypothetical protein
MLIVRVIFVVCVKVVVVVIVDIRDGHWILSRKWTLKSISEINKNCLGSFQVLWNKNCTTENEEIMMKKLIENLNPKKQTK